MKSALSAALTCLALLPSPANGQFTPFKHSEYQAVYDDGTSAWPAVGSPRPIELTGVVINNPWDTFNGDNSEYSPEWQVFIQTTTLNDYGGTALYMRKNKPKDVGVIYDETAELTWGVTWQSEMDRLNYPLFEGFAVTEPLRYGDVIKVQAKGPGLFYAGKYNVNERHSADPANDFDLTILERNVMPAVANITLAQLKDGSNNFCFNENRSLEDNCEHYQSSLVRLQNLLLDDPENWNWTSDPTGGTVIVRQGSLTFPMKLGRDTALAMIDPYVLQTSPFSVTAILDQECFVGPYTGNYRLWLPNTSGLTVVPEPCSFILLIAGGLTALLALRRCRIS